MDSPRSSSAERNLAAYYDAEFADRSRRGLEGMRLEKRAEALATYLRPRRDPLLDIGMGPARETVQLADAGFTVIGFDLSLETCRYAVGLGSAVVNGSVVALPFADNSIGDAWTMSVLMHLDDIDVSSALREIARVLKVDGRLIVGTWGGEDAVDFVDNSYGAPRPFYRRTDQRWQAMVEANVGRVEEFTTGHFDVTEGWWYQWCVARIR